MMRRAPLPLAATLALLGIPGVTFAGVTIPCPSCSTAPGHISIVGLGTSGAPDPIGEVMVVVRDISYAGYPHSLVIVDFSGCPDVNLCLDSRDANVIVNCANHWVSRLTNTQGEARFNFIGGLGTGASSLGDCVKIYADGVLIHSAAVAIYDLVGNDGVSTQDLSVWLDDFFSGAAPAHDDYDGNGVVGPGDLSQWLKVYFAGGSSSNCMAGRCP